ncbi:hypothetical protein GEV29_13830 [Aeromicrobium sp. SMF47]|nr:hypothetical protein [Aeromicrobium yanjiei]MRK01988.1 hypothetical protein [Aeromicrobium sp. S22]
MAWARAALALFALVAALAKHTWSVLGPTALLPLVPLALLTVWVVAEGWRRYDDDRSYRVYRAIGGPAFIVLGPTALAATLELITCSRPDSRSFVHTSKRPCVSMSACALHGHCSSQPGCSSRSGSSSSSPPTAGKSASTGGSRMRRRAIQYPWAARSSCSRRARSWAGRPGGSGRCWPPPPWATGSPHGAGLRTRRRASRPARPVHVNVYVNCMPQPLENRARPATPIAASSTAANTATRNALELR